jgi:co-chaperonin GroES (HSP10)
MGIEIKKLLGNRIMIDPETLEQSTKSGIILPASMIKEKQGVGVILMIGEEVFHEHESEKLVVGQKVLYGKLAGS